MSGSVWQEKTTKPTVVVKGIAVAGLIIIQGFAALNYAASLWAIASKIQ